MRFLLTAATMFIVVLVLAPPARAAWVWPLAGEVITPYSNGDDPYAGGQHRGIDIAGPVGARVVAAAGGEVRFAATAGSSGLTVAVRTTDGFDTSYLHLSSVAVRKGEPVRAGNELGAVGTTGARSTARPHLHFGVREAGSRHAYRNPLDFLPPPSAPPPVEVPHATPAPAPVPAPLAPVWAPVGGSLPVGAPESGRVPLRVPAGGRVPGRLPAGGRAPLRVPTGGRVPWRVPAGGHVPRHVPAGAPSRVPAGERAPRPIGREGRALRPAPLEDAVTRDAQVERPAPDGGRALRASPAAEEPARQGAGPGRSIVSPAEAHTAGGSPATNPAGPREVRSADGRGPDIGWVLACLGLLLAAALLGLTDDGRKAARRGRSRVARLVQPLVGGG